MLHIQFKYWKSWREIVEQLKSALDASIIFRMKQCEKMDAEA